MPNPTSITQYPTQWLEMIRAVAINGRSIVVSQLASKPLTRNQAAQMRFRFYAIRGLLRKDPIQQELYALSESIQAVILGQEQIYEGTITTWSLVFSPRDKNAEALALQGALEVKDA